MEKITFISTSCNRNDLLFLTVNSFIKNNNYPINKWIIKEDSGLENNKKEIEKKYNFIEVIGGDNVGQAISLDILYSKVDTEYVFQCEEDWFFDNSNPNFLYESLEILKNFDNIHQVWIRKEMEKWSENWQKFNNIEFGTIKDKHLDEWNGFSWNPSLRRLSDYKKMFPTGFQSFITTHKSGAIVERNCMLETRNFNYKAALLKNCVCNHLGDKNPTKKN